MARPLNDDPRAVVASARALLEELVEEGLEEPIAQLRPEAPPRAEAATQPAPEAHPAPPRRATPAPAPPAPPEAPGGAPAPASFALAAEVPTFGESASLDDVRAVLGDCTRCRLCEGRNQIVFGDGDPDADIVFVGEGPGQEEDRRGLPFVGRAGELLTQMIEKGLEIPRSSVYICNIVKCRPPNNRTPLADEVTRCRPFLDAQLRAVKPRVIVALGKPATSLLLGRDVSITRVRGQWHDYRGTPLMPTYHPAFILRQYTAENRRLVWEDLKAALTRSQESAAAPSG